MLLYICHVACRDGGAGLGLGTLGLNRPFISHNNCLAGLLATVKSSQLPSPRMLRPQPPRTPGEQDQNSRVKTPIKAEKAEKLKALNFGVVDS